MSQRSPKSKKRSPPALFGGLQGAESEPVRAVAVPEAAAPSPLKRFVDSLQRAQKLEAETVAFAVTHGIFGLLILWVGAVVGGGDVTAFSIVHVAVGGGKKEIGSVPFRAKGLAIEVVDKTRAVIEEYAGKLGAGSQAFLVRACFGPSRCILEHVTCPVFTVDGYIAGVVEPYRVPQKPGPRPIHVVN
jgi:hypothetical protein